MGRIFLITVLLIVYGSLYPFDFHVPHVDNGPVWVLLHAWPEDLNRFLIKDVGINIFIYLPFGMFGSLWLAKNRPPSPAIALRVAAIALALSFAMEMLQYFDDHRVVSILDVITNLAGAILGIFPARLYGKIVAGRLDRPEMQEATQPSGALILLFAWCAYQLYPAFPQLSTYAVGEKLAVLIHSSNLSWAPALFGVVDWLTVALLLEEVGVAGYERFLFPLLIALLPARLLIVNRTVTWAELGSAAAACILWRLWFLHGSKIRAPLLAWLAACTLLARGLAPYHWIRPARPFAWEPFRSVLISDWSSAGPIFFNKCFLYGAAVWLFHKAGYSYLRTTIWLAGLLAVIEALQRYLPGRTPEISDPLMLIILAIVLVALDTPRRVMLGAASAKHPGGSPVC